MRLEIDGEYTGIRFSACHFIAGHEKCGRMHGHTYVVSLKLHGGMGTGGMMMDFIPLKKQLRTIADQLDHRILVPAESKKIEISIAGDEVLINAGCKRYVLPSEDVVMLPTAESSAEELCQFILARVIETVSFPENISRIEVGVHEELGQSAWVEKRLRDEP